MDLEKFEEFVGKVDLLLEKVDSLTRQKENLTLQLREKNEEIQILQDANASLEKERNQIGEKVEHLLGRIDRHLSGEI